MKKLTELGILYKTDKATHHKFTDFYDGVFETFTYPKILEIGVARCASLRTYDDYYKGLCDITGFDNGEFLKDRSRRKNIRLIIGDQSKKEDLKRCIENKEIYDIIIDDGGHYMDQQQISFNFLFDYLAPGGVYIIEDLHTSLDKRFNPGNIISTLDILTQLTGANYTKISPHIDKKDFDRIERQIKSIQIIWVKSKKNGRASITSIIQKL